MIGFLSSIYSISSARERQSANIVGLLALQNRYHSPFDTEQILGVILRIPTVGKQGFYGTFSKKVSLTADATYEGFFKQDGILPRSVSTGLLGSDQLFRC